MALSELIERIIDIFYIGPLRRIPRRTFQYAAIGGGVQLLNMFVFWFSFHFVFDKMDTDFGIVVISAPVMSFLVAFVVSFFMGFYLQRNVAFSDSSKRGKVQLFRYSQVVVVNIAINYFGLKLLGRIIDYPTICYALVQIVTVIFSYLAQRFYTFGSNRGSNSDQEEISD